MASDIKGAEESFEIRQITPPRSPDPLAPSTSLSLSPSDPSPTGMSAPALVLTSSSKRIDQVGKKKYIKQVTGRHNDTELHLAAQRGDLAAIKQIFSDISSQMGETLSLTGAELDTEVAEVRTAMVNEVNELEETALYIASEKGHVEVVRELLSYCNKDTLTRKNKSGFDPLHVAATVGHLAMVQLLLDHDPSLVKTIGTANATPLITAATKGHTAVVNELLSRDNSLIEICKSNGKNALHFAARQGHLDIVKALLDKDLSLANKTDRKGQTAIHLAAKGLNCQVVKLLLDVDSAVVMHQDKFGNTALHVAARKKRVEESTFTAGLKPG